MTDDRQLPIQPDPGPAADPDAGRPAGERAPARRPNPPLPPPTRREPPSTDARPRRPEYRGEELDPERGPGLGCFWFQMIVLGFFIVIIPVGLNLNWPFEVLAILLFVVIGLLLLTGQTVIFLLRLVAADRRSAGRRRPLASATKTVGEIEDDLEEPAADATGTAPPEPAPAAVAGLAAAGGPEDVPEPAAAPPAPARVTLVDAESIIAAQTAAPAGLEPSPGSVAPATDAFDARDSLADSPREPAEPSSEASVVVGEQEPSTESRRSGSSVAEMSDQPPAPPHAAPEPADAPAAPEPADAPAAPEPPPAAPAIPAPEPMPPATVAANADAAAVADAEPEPPEEPDPGVRQ